MGLFIVLEGGDASGKSTQARLLADRLRSRDRDVVETFEPGATQTGAAIRALLLDGDEPIEPTTEALLLAADRAQEIADVIRPALGRGADVVSDRYVPSSLAYQGVGRGLGVEKPDLVVVLDVDEAVATSRRATPGDRLEQAGAEFHAAVRDAYRTLAADRGWIVLDGSADAEIVGARVWELVGARLEV